VAFYVASATLPPPIIAEIRCLLHINPDSVTQILCSNNCPDIALRVQEMKHPPSSYEDLGFLIPHNWQTEMDGPPKFLVFFDDIKEAEAATKFFHQWLLRDHHSEVMWFHSTMSQHYHEEKVQQFCNSEIWGLICTDAFGLVSYLITMPKEDLLTLS
jgi:superfamily II DNA/RNA helicase